MASAREWSAGRLVAAWAVAAVVVALSRQLFEAGVYEAHMEGQRVVISSGLWSASFADALTALVALASFAAVAWLTYSWLTGARDRRRLKSMEGGEHRKPLM